MSDGIAFGLDASKDHKDFRPWKGVVTMYISRATTSFEEQNAWLQNSFDDKKMYYAASHRFQTMVVIAKV